MQPESVDRLVASMKISRERAQLLGREMVEILRVGHYAAPYGCTVNVERQIQDAVTGTVSYPPERSLPNAVAYNNPMTVEVRNETTLAAVRRLLSQGFNPAALNFASATSPGGGFLDGARAQEEYLARSSALWSCLRENPMYRLHRGRNDPFYTDYVIYCAASLTAVTSRVEVPTMGGFPFDHLARSPTLSGDSRRQSGDDTVPQQAKRSAYDFTSS